MRGDSVGWVLDKNVSHLGGIRDCDSGLGFGCGELWLLRVVSAKHRVAHRGQRRLHGSQEI